MKKVIFLLLFGFTAFAQDNILNDSLRKSNPIVFGEILLGYSSGSSKGFTGGITLNYQSKSNLFTYRYYELSHTRKQGTIVLLPLYITVENVKEHALMYGKRSVNNNFSYSYSAGISYVDREFLIDSSNDVLTYDNSQNIGFPFEINVKWFKSEKRKYRIYELIPVGKPTSFGNSIGFKLYGDISKTTFIGLGVTFGLGWHKNY